MSIPINELVFAGVWNATTPYPQFQFVVSPLDAKAYVQVGLQPALGGADPSTGLPNWVVYPSLSSFVPVYGSFETSASVPLMMNAYVSLPYNVATVPPVNITAALPTSLLQVGLSGVYKITNSVQLLRNNNLPPDSIVEISLKVNGSHVANSNRRIRITDNPIDTITLLDWVVPLLGGDVLELVAFTSDNTNGLINAPATVIPVPPFEVLPAIPSITTTLLRIS